VDNNKKIKNKKHRRNNNKVMFSIGAKLVLIVTLIVLVSLGSITALVSMLVRQDLRLSAEDTNFEANRRSASEAEDTLTRMQSDAMILTQMISSAGVNSVIANETVDFFFGRNKRVAAIVFTAQNQADMLLTNSERASIYN